MSVSTVESFKDVQARIQTEEGVPDMTQQKHAESSHGHEVHNSIC